MLKLALSAFAAVMLVAGCGGDGVKPEVPSPSGATKPDIRDIKIEGDRDTPANKLAIEAIADLQTYWGTEFPKLYGEDYKPVEGGLYALTPDSESGPACASNYGDVSGNAFYCKLDDSVAWDASGLLPELQEKYGDFVIPVVLAHEWGHAMQQRSGFFDQNGLTVSSELQADCFAGGWARHAQDDKVFDVSGADLDRSLAGILDLRDTPGTNAQDPSAHGSGFDRVSAFQDGYDNGAEKCKDYEDGEPIVLELPFNDAEDEANEGNAPYDSIVNGVPYDLEDYWSQVYPEIADGKTWTPLQPQQPFDPSSPPGCGGQSAEGYALFYCVPDDYVGWDNVERMPQIYSEGGDYAVATLLATQWGLAALDRLGDDSDELTSTARGDCLAGAYTASVILYNREATSSYHISPGDLDEGIKALLLFRGEGDVDRREPASTAPGLSVPAYSTVPRVACRTRTDSGTQAVATAPPWTMAYLLKSRSSSVWVDVEIELGDENLRCVTRGYSRWVDEELGLPDYAARISLGEPVVVFDYRRDQIEATWLRQFYRGGFQVSQGNSRRWVITLVYPTGFGSLLDLMTDRAVWRSWRSALPATCV